MYNLPDNSHRYQVFTENGSWKKPEGIVMVQILCIGAGGGGGAGGPAGSAFGGGSGGSGGISRLLVPAIFLPDTLTILVGKGGGPDPFPDGPGATGGVTRISFAYDSTNVTTLQQTSLLVANGGGGANNGAGNGLGGSAALIATASDNRLAGLGISSYVAGQVGVTSVASASTNTSVSASTHVLYPAAPGSGRSTTGLSGGTVFGIEGIVPNIVGGSAGGGRAQNGFTNFEPFYSVGGAGGGAYTTGSQGGAGGDGGFGCGGGGGGAGTTGAFLGPGGKGGNGIVIITCW